jgi:prefoldin subunit 5
MTKDDMMTKIIGTLLAIVITMMGYYIKQLDNQIAGLNSEIAALNETVTDVRITQKAIATALEIQLGGSID